MSALDAMRCFETLVERMEGAVAIDAWLLGLGDEGALLAERLAARLPSKHNHVALNLHALAQGELRTVPGAALSEILSAISFESTPIVLIDAVLWRGETIVQAVSLLRQHGIHTPIELAVLADRGGYLVPVAPTYCGSEIIVAEGTVLRLVADGGILRFSEA